MMKKKSWPILSRCNLTTALLFFLRKLHFDFRGKKRKRREVTADISVLFCFIVKRMKDEKKNDCPNGNGEAIL